MKGDEEAVVPYHRVAFRHDGLHLVAEPLAAEPLGMAADGRHIERAIQRGRDRVGKRLGCRFVDEQTGFAGDARSRARLRGPARRPDGRTPALRAARCRSLPRPAAARRPPAGTASRTSSSESRPRNCAAPWPCVRAPRARGRRRQSSAARGRACTPRSPHRCACRGRAPTR